MPNPIVLGANGDVKADLERELTKLNEAISPIPDLGRKLDTLADAFSEAKSIIDKFNSRFTVADGAVAASIAPVTEEDWQQFGIKALHGVQTKVTMGYTGGYDAPADPLAKWQDASDLFYLYCTVKGIDPKVAPHAAMNTPFYKRHLAPATKQMLASMSKAGAFDTATSGEGSEWVPTEYSARLWEKVRLALRVAGLFEEIPMPRSPFVLPVWISDLTAYAAAESTATTSDGMQDMSGTISANRTLTARLLGGYVAVSRNLEEDSIVPILSLLERALVQALANGIENAIINGDDTNFGATPGANQDSDITGKYAIEKAWDGLRYIGLSVAATKKDVGGTANLSSAANWNDYVIGARKLLKRFGVNPADVALIVGGSTNMNLLQNADFRTAASLAGWAKPTQVSGAIGSFYGGFEPDGMTYVVSEYVRENLNASGVYDGVTTTKTHFILVNKKSWVLGRVRGVTLQMLKELFALTDQDGIVMTTRVAFQQPVANHANNPHTVVGYNVAP